MTGCPKDFKKRCGDKNDQDLAKIFGVHPNTIRNWKQSQGIPFVRHPKVDYTQVDLMLSRFAKPSDISKETGISESTIKKRRSLMFKTKAKGRSPKKSELNASYASRAVEMIAPRDRAQLAYERMAEKMEMPLDHFMTKWLPHNDAWQRDMGFR